MGGEEPSSNPRRGPFFDRTSVPTSEAGPAPSRWGTPRSSANLGGGIGQPVEAGAAAEADARA
eukprot:8040301-Alexandrium_andersonii.AAC.1